MRQGVHANAACRHQANNAFRMSSPSLHASRASSVALFYEYRRRRNIGYRGLPQGSPHPNCFRLYFRRWLRRALLFLTDFKLTRHFVLFQFTSGFMPVSIPAFKKGLPSLSGMIRTQAQMWDSPGEATASSAWTRQRTCARPLLPASAWLAACRLRLPACRDAPPPAPASAPPAPRAASSPPPRASLG